MSRPMSPTRLVRKALSAASEFGLSSHQCPMRANEQTPTSSQPTIICSVFSLTTKKQHRGGEQAQEGEVVRVAAVAGHVVGGVDVHQQRDRRDDEQHRDGEAVDERADREVDTTVAPPRDGLDDGVDADGGAFALLGCGDERAAGGEQRLFAVFAAGHGVAFGHPLDAGEHGEDPRRGDRGDADLGALVGKRLPKNRMATNESAGSRGISHTFSRNQPDAS